MVSSVSMIAPKAAAAKTPNTTSNRKLIPTTKLIIEPKNGDTVSDVVKIRLRYTCNLYIDRVLVAKGVTAYKWDTTGVTDGPHSIIAVCRNYYYHEIKVLVENDIPPPPEEKLALIVGISDYKAISDLSFCDEDATDWFNYLLAIGYDSDNIIVLGDTHQGNYPKYDGLATESTINYWLNWLVTQDCDEIAFITSGHGGGNGYGWSYNCAWDCGAGENGEDGYLDDYELEAIFTNAIAPKVFVFMDHCYSGGMIPEFSSACGNKLYMTTTCTENGYGWDSYAHQNGLWTYYFLEYSLINHFGTDPETAMEDAFTYAHAGYPYGGGDEPQECDNFPGPFTL
jgi:hypothetical protein